MPVPGVYGGWPLVGVAMEQHPLAYTNFAFDGLKMHNFVLFLV